MALGNGPQRVLAFLGAALGATAMPAQTIEQLREELRESARAVRFPAYLAAFLGLSEEAEMSGGRMRVDEGDTITRMTVFTLPFRREFEVAAGAPAFVVEATAGYARATQSVDDVFDGVVPAFATAVASRFESLGGTLAAGPGLALGDAFHCDLGVVGGIGYVRSRAEYSGPGSALVAAWLDGILFNWDATYAIYGGTAVLRRDGWRLGDVTVEPLLRFDVRRVDPLATDDVAQDEAATVQWAIARLGCEGPTEVTMGDGAIDWTADLAYKRFVDDSGRLLGFDDYFEFGAGLHWRCDRDLPLASRLGLEAAVLLGEDLLGWTLGLTVRF